MGVLQCQYFFLLLLAPRRALLSYLYFGVYRMRLCKDNKTPIIHLPVNTFLPPLLTIWPLFGPLVDKQPLLYPPSSKTQKVCWVTWNISIDCCCTMLMQMSYPSMNLETNIRTANLCITSLTTCPLSYHALICQYCLQHLSLSQNIVWHTLINFLEVSSFTTKTILCFHVVQSQ